MSLRDESGLLKSVEYIRTPEGFINWRAMLKPEHLYVNPSYEDELKTRFNVKSTRDIDVTKCEDKQLLVLLEGWRYLMKLRGVKSVCLKMDYVSNEKATATCSIEFIGNFETGGESLTWADTASASLYSVTGSFQLHLEAMAANRALARCVRAALGIKIYGKDEFDAKANEKFENALKTGVNPLLPQSSPHADAQTAISPQEKLRDDCSSLGYTFEALKTRSAEAYVTHPQDFTSDPNTWEDWDSIPRRDVYTLSVKIRDAKAKKKKA
ncbi:MAG: hypothetical protein HQK54_13510 [Oligoflexales bacterium]|nr:hypothetical protein [Oligoflexales bacterium]